MKFYSFADIRAAADCVALAESLYGCVVKHGRCAARWRDGDDPENVSIEKEKFYDHVKKSGGGAVALAAFKFGGDIQQAQEYLGDLYHLKPKMETGAAPNPDSRYDKLIRDGWKQVALYEYRNLAGKLIHFVARLQHPDKPGEKEFCQGIPDGRGGGKWGLHGTETILYNWKTAAASPWVAVVEGEKSADRMNAIGIPAVTACGGAKKWHSALSEALRGKDVAIFPDNDEPGREHAQVVAASLHGIAASVRIVHPAPELPAKAGIDDWVNLGHTADDVLALIAAAPVYRPATISLHEAVESEPTPAALAEAKSANSVPFRNYVPGEKITERRGKQVKEETKEPRTHAAMLDDLSRRFLGFPRKVGDHFLFDHDRDSGKIIEIRDSDDLLAWIARRSKHQPSWARGDEMSTSKQFLSSVIAVAHRYEAISLIPDWPRRPDVYYAHGKIPPPTPDHTAFHQFVEFFNPTTEYDRCLISAFVCAPLWFVPGIARPCWIIDSKDGPGSGKTKLVELIAQLYGNDPIRTSKQELNSNLQQLVKRCVSNSGRNARVLLVDNVKGDFDSSELSDLITARSISGMAPYGHGEETRPNNLTYTITVNTATVSTDLASRSFYISVNKPAESAMSSRWYSKIQKFIAKHQYQIISDIIDTLASHQPFNLPTRTRFPEFEQTILQPCCATPENTIATLDHIFSARAESNIEEELAHAIIDVFKFNLSQEGIDPDGTPVFIQTNVVNSWGRYAINEAASTMQDRNVIPIQVIRNLAKALLIPNIDPNQKRFPFSHRKGTVFSGIAWNFSDTTEAAIVVTKRGDGGIEKKTVLG